jgi:hypothetical protein
MKWRTRKKNIPFRTGEIKKIGRDGLKELSNLKFGSILCHCTFPFPSGKCLDQLEMSVAKPPNVLRELLSTLSYAGHAINLNGRSFREEPIEARGLVVHSFSPRLCPLRLNYWSSRIFVARGGARKQIPTKLL